MVHIVAIASLSGASVATAVMGDHAIATMEEEQHLPGSGAGARGRCAGRAGGTWTGSAGRAEPAASVDQANRRGLGFRAGLEISPKVLGDGASGYRAHVGPEYVSRL